MVRSWKTPTRSKTSTRLRTLDAIEDADAIEDINDLADDGEAPVPMTIINQSPDPNAIGVYVDESLFVSFSHDLDDDTVNETTFRIEGPEGQVVGQRYTYGQVVTFVPVLLYPQTEYEIIVSTEVTSLEGMPLEEEFHSYFITGDTRVNGELAPTARDEEIFPTYVRLTRRAEFLAIGDSLEGSTDNINLLDPKFQSLREDKTHNEEFGDLSQTFEHFDALNSDHVKVAISADLDEDFREDAFIVSNTLTDTDKDPGEAFVIRITGEEDAEQELAVDALNLDLSITPMSGSWEFDNDWYTYQLAKGNIDDDGLDEIVIIGEYQGSAKVWVVDSEPSDVAGQPPIYSVLSSWELERSKPIYGAAVAISDLDSDGAAEIAVAYFCTDPDTTSAGEQVFLRLYGGEEQSFAEEAALNVDGFCVDQADTGNHCNRIASNDLYRDYMIKLAVGQFDDEPGDELIIGEQLSRRSDDAERPSYWRLCVETVNRGPLSTHRPLGLAHGQLWLVCLSAPLRAPLPLWSRRL